jgi:hypothetical protein
MWRYWPPLLVVVDPTIDHEKFLGAALRGIRHDVVDLTRIEEIRGLEYQHVFLVVAQWRLHQILEGRRGLSTAEYVAARSLRVPFSRATERLSVFAVLS